jgi:hypothetical protein
MVRREPILPPKGNPLLRLGFPAAARKRPEKPA